MVNGVTTEERVPRLSDVLWGRLRRVHGWTNGWSTDLLNVWLNMGRTVSNRESARSEVFKTEVTSAQAREFADVVRDDSHAILPITLDSDTCGEIVRHCLTLPCKPYPRPTNSPAEIPFDIDHPVAPMNFFGLAQGVHLHPTVAALMNDPVLLAIARAYLGCEPILDTFHVWASPVFGKGPSSEAAQLFHYDMAHPKFVKFFVYLTDVTPASGPHCVVPTSHHRDWVGWKLRFNSNRISDSAIERAYPGLARELTGAKGTLIAEDTRAFHKGKQPTAGCRFILEAYFVNAVVGAALPEPERVRRDLLQRAPVGS